MAGVDTPGLRAAMVTARYRPMDSTGTIRVGILRDRLPDHGIVPVVVTLPAAWARQQGQLVGEVDATEPDVLRPTSWSDGAVRALSRVPVARRVQRTSLRPDVLLPWARAVPRRVAAAAELQPVDVVLATGPPFSALEAGRRLAHRLGVPFVAELRDPPGLDRSTGGLGPVGTARVRRFARHCLTDADAVIVVTPAVKDHLARDHGIPRHRIVVMPNSAPVVADEGPVAPRPGGAGVVLAYVGSLRGPGDWRLLGELVETLAARTPPGELRLVGSHRAAGAAEVVTMVGRVDRARALEEMASADACLVLVGEDEPWWIGRKVLEGLGTARQLLAIAPPGDTADLLAHSSRSIVVDRTGVTRADLARAVAEVAARRDTPPDGPEPAVPDDATLAAGVADVLRAVVRGAALPADWSWRNRP